MSKPNVIMILGPTGVGKTEVSVRIAKKLNAEIISADSVQIYKGLNIGSAKITKEEMQGIPHHLIDVIEPSEEFSVSMYVEETLKIIHEICMAGKTPIIVGGTGLYVKSLIRGYSFGGVGKTDLRAELEQRVNVEGLDKIYDELLLKTPESLISINRNDKKRIIRAYEKLIYGSVIENVPPDMNFLVYALSIERETLYDRINKRVDIMLEQGLIKEVKALKELGLTNNNQSMKAIGYKEVLSFLDGKICYDECVSLIKQHSRNYAKRQLTFLRGMEEVKFIDAADKAGAVNYIIEDIKGRL